MIKFEQTKETKGRVEAIEDGKTAGEIITMGDIIIKEEKPKRSEEEEKIREKLRKMGWLYGK
jgi:hypothetical protein